VLLVFKNVCADNINQSEKYICATCTREYLIGPRKANAAVEKAYWWSTE